MKPWLPATNRLEGKRILILAEVPDTAAREGRERPTSPVLEAEEAVATLVRAIVAEGGEVRLIGDTSLALLAGVVAGEYAVAELQEGQDTVPRLSVIVQRLENEAQDPLDRLEALGSVRVNRMGDMRAALREFAGGSDAMVCVGSGSPDDVEVFRRTNGADRAVFVLAATGGGAARMSELAESYRIDVADRAVEREAPLPQAGDDVFGSETLDEGDPLPPMALTAQWIVDRLIRGSERGPRLEPLARR